MTAALADSNSPSERKLWALALLPVFIGIAIRLYLATHWPLHDDEIWSMMLGTGRGSMQLNVPAQVVLPSPATVTQLAGAQPWKTWITLDQATHPPGYFTLLGFWRYLLGPSALTARVLSILASGLFLLLTFHACRRLISTEAGLWASLILAIGCPFAELTTNIRPYAVTLAMLLIAITAWVQLHNRRLRPGLLLLFTGTLGLLLTHYFSAGSVFALALSCFLLPKGCRRKAILTLLAACALYSLIWLPFFFEQLRRGIFGASEATTQFLTDGNITIALTLALLLRVISSPFFPFYRWSFLYYLALNALVISGVVTSILSLRSHSLFHQARGLLMLALMATGGIAAPLALDLLRHSSHLGYIRYFVFFTPLATLLACALFAHPSFSVANSSRGPLSRILPRLAPSCLLFMALLSWNSSFQNVPNDYSRTTRWIEQYAAGSDANPPLILISAVEPEYRLLARVQWLLHEYYATRPSQVILSLDPNDPSLSAQFAGRTVYVILAPRRQPPEIPGYRAAPPQQLDALHAVTILYPVN